MNEEPKCQVCGCTELQACTTLDGPPCSWIAVGMLCSACLNKVPLPQNDEEALELVMPLAEETVRMQLPGVEAFQLLSTLQLALRHPDFPEALAGQMTILGRALQERISLTPGLAALAEKGWHQEHDVPAEPKILLPGKDF
jgi:hypothetical protein